MNVVASPKTALTAALLVASVWLGCSTSDASSQAQPSDDAGLDHSASPAPAPPPTAPGADASSSDSGDAADPPRNDSPGCISYCDTIVSACAPDYAQYGSKTACLNACVYFPPGSPGDINGNSLECRNMMAMNTVGAPQVHCLHGGPYGYGGCGSMCEGFCEIVMPWCGSKAPFASHDACMNECVLWAWAPSLPDGGAAYRASGPTSGDTLDCREVMLVKALESPAARDTYCPLTATNSATCR